MKLFCFLYVAISLTTYVIAQSDAACPPLFLRFSTDHSYCKPPNPTCNILKTFVTDNDISVILKEHNNLRSKLARGKEPNLPAAADMLEMVWDSELAAVAQKHANQCLFKHDCSECRQVQNFAVGQNIASEYVTGSPDIPNLNWPSAIKSWYDEIAYFSRNGINSYVASPPLKPTYGHFSQVAWAKSWRIGCGYVTYSEQSNEYKTLYVCNYGPAGNVLKKRLYKEGLQCSKCPINSCCDKTCGASANYPGLCKINNDSPPMYQHQGSYLFYCDFDDQPDCQNYVTGKNKWKIYSTLNGKYLGIVLKGGEESSMAFINKIKPTGATEMFCFSIKYRKGSNVAGQEENSEATETFRITSNNFVVKQILPSFDNFKHEFSQYLMQLSWKDETEFNITFSVPPGKPEQFLEIDSIFASDGKCSH